MLDLRLYFAWGGYTYSVHTYGVEWKELQDRTLEDIKSTLVNLVRTELRFPVHEDYITFWTFRQGGTYSYAIPTKDPFRTGQVIAVDSSTRIGDSLRQLHTLCMKSGLPAQRTPSDAERADMVENISEIYALLRDTQPPFCAGTCPVSVDKCTIYYRTTDGLREINLANATVGELEQLTRACKPAPFGRNDQDVYDESYRKAWKMDGGDYIANFNVDDTDIISIIKSKLVQFGNQYDRGIELELYKLNVYGKGSFFKSHKDTPRSDRMFGSLVVVFPTAHEGGVFTMRHHDEHWETDLAAMLFEAKETPSVSFVAFYSDIDHEVKEVTSGYRVTLTYNLSFTSSTSPHQNAAPNVRPVPNNAALYKAIDNIVSDDIDIFQYGAYLAFGLLYQYPVSDQGSVASLRTCLKGQDAALANTLDAASLKWDLRVCYRSEVQLSHPKYFLSQYVVQFGPYANIFEFDHLLPDAEYVTFVRDSPFESISSLSGDGPVDVPSSEGRILVPLTPIPRFPRKPSEFIEYGNQALAGKLYADVCLVVEIPAEIPGSEQPPRFAVVEARKEHLDLGDDSGGENEE